MMNEFIKPTTVMLKDSKKTNTIFTGLVLLVVFGQLLCASGSGPSTSNDPISGWIHTAMNIANVVIAFVILIPKTRAVGALLSSLILFVSMSANLKLYGFGFFVKLLPFDLLFFVPSIAILIHFWPDLLQTFKKKP